MSAGQCDCCPCGSAPCPSGLLRVSGLFLRIPADCGVRPWGMPAACQQRCAGRHGVTLCRFPAACLSDPVSAGGDPQRGNPPDIVTVRGRGLSDVSCRDVIQQRGHGYLIVSPLHQLTRYSSSGLEQPEIRQNRFQRWVRRVCPNWGNPPVRPDFCPAKTGSSDAKNGSANGTQTQRQTLSAGSPLYCSGGCFGST